MPTDPITDLLDREEAVRVPSELIDLACPLLRELVNHGTVTYERCQRSARGDEDEDLPVQLSYLHIIEMADAIEVLLSNGCTYPAQPLLRSMFEALVAIEYMTERDYTRRSYAWMVGYVHGRLARYRRLNPATAAGRELREALAGDRITAPFEAVRQEDAQPATENLERLLARSQYRDAEAEYQSVKKRRKRGNPTWHSLYDGPSSTRDLARHVGKLGLYVILYGPWSTVTHGADVSHWLTRTDEGTPAIYQLRNPLEFKSTAQWAVHFVLDATRLVNRKYTPYQKLDRWYRKDIQERYVRLTNVNVTLADA